MDDNKKYTKRTPWAQRASIVKKILKERFPDCNFTVLSRRRGPVAGMIFIIWDNGPEIVTVESTVKNTVFGQLGLGEFVYTRKET